MHMVYMASLSPYWSCWNQSFWKDFNFSKVFFHKNRQQQQDVCFKLVFSLLSLTFNQHKAKWILPVHDMLVNMPQIAYPWLSERTSWGLQGQGLLIYKSWPHVSLLWGNLWVKHVGSFYTFPKSLQHVWLLTFFPLTDHNTQQPHTQCNNTT